jgi:hypothetical protein
VREWEAGFVRFLKSEQKELLDTIEKQKALDDNLFEKLKAAISTFNKQFGVEEAKEAPDKGAKAADAAKPGDKAQPKAQAPVAKAEAQAPAPAAQPEPKASAPVAEAEAPAAPAAQPEPRASAPAAKAEAPAVAPAKVEVVQAEADPDAGPRPSQLNQIRAALADTPAAADSTPKPKRPRKPKA